MPRTLKISRKSLPAKKLVQGWEKQPDGSYRETSDISSDSESDMEQKTKAQKKEVLPDTEPLTLAVLVKRACSSEIDDHDLCLEFDPFSDNIIVKGKVVRSARLDLKRGWCGFWVVADVEDDEDEKELITAKFSLDNCGVTVDPEPVGKFD